LKNKSVFLLYLPLKYELLQRLFRNLSLNHKYYKKKGINNGDKKMVKKHGKHGDRESVS